MGRSIIWAALAASLSIAHARSGLCADGAAAGAPSPASRAETPSDPSAHPDTKADEIFHEGRALLKDKRYADACPKFEESQRQAPASATLLALAYCQELSGLLATARVHYLDAARLAEREGRTDRQTAANERAQMLSARVSKLTVTAPAELLVLPGFRLTLDGFEFERASFGTPVALDGGTHAFVATAPGRSPWTSTVTLLAEQDQKTLMLPVLDPAPLAAQEVAHTPPGRANAPNVDDDASSRAAYQRASLGFAAATVVGLGVGTGFAIAAKSKNDQSNRSGCDASNACEPPGDGYRRQALNDARVATWAFVASGALAVCSITLYLTSRPKSLLSARSLPVGAQLSLGPRSVWLGGSF